MNAKYDNDELVANSQRFLNMWKDYFYQLLNAHGDNYVMQTEMHITEILVSGHSYYWVSYTYWNSKNCKSPVTDRFGQKQCKKVGCSIHKPIICIRNKGQLLVEEIHYYTHHWAQRKLCTHHIPSDNRTKSCLIQRQLINPLKNRQSSNICARSQQINCIHEEINSRTLATILLSLSVCPHFFPSSVSFFLIVLRTNFSFQTFYTSRFASLATIINASLPKRNP